MGRGNTTVVIDCDWVQPFEFKVTSYITGTAARVVFCKISEMIETPVFAGLLIPGTGLLVYVITTPDVNDCVV